MINTPRQQHIRHGIKKSERDDFRHQKIIFVIVEQFFISWAMISVFIYRWVIPKKMKYFFVCCHHTGYVDLCMLLRSGNSAGTNRAPRARAHVNKFPSFVWMDVQYIFMKFMLCCDDYYYDVQRFSHCSRALTEYILSSRKNMKINIMRTFSTVVGVNSGIKLSFAESEKNLLNIFSFSLGPTPTDPTTSVVELSFMCLVNGAKKKERSVWCDVVDDVSAREEKCGENRKKLMNNKF